MPRFRDALDARIGYRKFLTPLLDEPIPGGASWAYVFGSGTLILFVVQLLTGATLALYYSPSSTSAWASVAYIEHEVSMGAFVRAMHHHAASAMIIVAVLHMLQVVLYGAYKAPREVNWLSGLLLFGLVMAFALTGYLLPWDQTGYWATKVATGILGTVPLIGALLQEVAQGGNDYGNLTLTRFYALHAIILPLSVIALLAVHLALFRKHGVTPAPRIQGGAEARDEVHDLFWPKQVFYDAVFAVVAIGLLALVSMFVPAPLEAPADPSSNFIARPEWYFLSLFQLLKYFEGASQIVGTLIIPVLVASFLLLVPFLDRGSSRSPKNRLPWILSFAGGLAATAVLTAIALRHDARDPTLETQRLRSRREAARARVLARSGVPVEGAGAMMARDPITRGERVFEEECSSCHVLEGRGPARPKGPELTGYRSKAWIRQVLRDPDSKRLFGPTRVEGMKSFARLGEADLGLIVDIVYAQRDGIAPPLDERAGRPLLDDHECTDCHDFDATAGLEGPTLYRYHSREWVRGVVDDAGAKHLYGDMDSMPAFEARISSQDRDAVVEFLLSLEARTPVDRWPSVDDPGPVPTPRAATSTLAREGAGGDPEGRTTDSRR